MFLASRPSLILSLSVVLLLALPFPALAAGIPSADPQYPARLIGGEVMAYQFDDGDFDQSWGGSVNDRSSFAAVGTRGGGPPVVAGPFDGALRFNAGQYVYASAGYPNGVTGLNTITYDFTLAGWFNFDSFSACQSLFGSRTTNNRQFIVWLICPNYMQITKGNPDGTESGYGFSLASNYGTWRHVAVVQDGIYLRLVVNGVTASTQIHTPGVYKVSPLSHYYIGAHDCCLSWYYGSIDEFRIYDRALTDAEIGSIKDLPYVRENGAPVLNPVGPLSVAEGNLLQFTVSATDTPGDVLTYSASGLPEGATFDAASRIFSWTPAFGQAGPHDVTFEATDGELSDSETVTIDVSNVNRPPMASAGGNLVLPCAGPLTSVTLDGSASSDPDLDPLAYAWSVADGTLTGDPAAATTTADFPVGTGVATLAVDDGELSDADAAIVTIVDGVAPAVTSTFPSGPGVYSGSSFVPGGEDVVIVGSVDVTAAAADGCDEIAEVRFTVGGETFVDTESPYGFTYAPAGVGVQYATLSVVAVDASGNESPPVEVGLTVATVNPHT